MKKKSKSTLDGLAKQIQTGFEAVGKHLDTVEKKINTAEKRFDTVDKRFELIDRRFNSLGKRLDGFATALAEDITAVDSKIDMMTGVVRKMDATIEGGFTEIQKKLDHSDIRVSGVEGVIVNRQPRNPSHS